MATAYWITCYRQVTDAAKLAEYGKAALPAIEAGGGRFLARSDAARAFEAGLLQRTVLIEFPSLEQAVATYEGAAYQAALVLLRGAALRDLRIVCGT